MIKNYQILDIFSNDICEKFEGLQPRFFALIGIIGRIKACKGSVTSLGSCIMKVGVELDVMSQRKLIGFMLND